MTEKKISIIGPSTRFLSGISYYTTYLSNALSKRCQVNAVLFRNMLPKFLFPGADRVGSSLSTIEYSEHVDMKECLDWYNPFTWFRAVKLIKNSDACIFEWWTSSVSHMYLVIGILLKIWKVPIILEFHEVVDTLEESILPIRAYSKVMGKLIRNLASEYVVHSEADRKLVSERYDIDEKRISIIPIGLFYQYASLDKSESRKFLGIVENNVILFFGLLRPYKGVTYLIQAFESLPDTLRENTSLVIAGEPWEDKEALELARLSPYSSQIKLYPEYISDEEVPIFFSSADVLVLPYIRASQSGVAHIAISYGMPIVASKVGGLVESLSKYSGSVFVPATDIDALSHALSSLLTQKKGIIYEVPKDLQWDDIAVEWDNLIYQIKNK